MKKVTVELFIVLSQFTLLFYEIFFEGKNQIGALLGIVFLLIILFMVSSIEEESLKK